MRRHLFAGRSPFRGSINSCIVYFYISDDIQEAYKRLRRLVMDYLGIGITSPPNSEIGDTDARGDNTDQNITTQMGTRTWSKPSISESMSQTFPRSSRNVQSPIQSGRGIVVSFGICILRKRKIFLYHLLSVPCREQIFSFRVALFEIGFIYH